MIVKTIPALAFIALCASSPASAGDGFIKVTCLVADQVEGGGLKAIKGIELKEVSDDTAVYESDEGLSYFIRTTTAGSGKNFPKQHLIFISIDKGEETIAQTGVAYTPGVAFNVMLTSNPQKETLTCSGK